MLNKVRVPLIIVLCLYQVLSASFVYLPPLMGIIFVLATLEAREEYFQKSLYFLLPYSVLIEAIHGFFIFSTAVVFIVFYSLYAKKLVLALKLANLIFFVLVLITYLGTYCFSILLSYALNLHIMTFGDFYLYYIAVETVFCMIFLRDLVA